MNYMQLTAFVFPWRGKGVLFIKFCGLPCSTNRTLYILAPGIFPGCLSLMPGMFSLFSYCVSWILLSLNENPVFYRKCFPTPLHYSAFSLNNFLIILSIACLLVVSPLDCDPLGGKNCLLPLFVFPAFNLMLGTQQVLPKVY